MLSIITAKGYGSICGAAPPATTAGEGLATREGEALGEGRAARPGLGDGEGAAEAAGRGLGLGTLAAA
jgi:hypothetical protein